MRGYAALLTGAFLALLIAIILWSCTYLEAFEIIAISSFAYMVIPIVFMILTEKTGG